MKSMALPFRSTLLILMLASAFARATLTLQGPVYPPPGGVSFSSAGGEMGQSGGHAWSYANTLTAATNVVYWGATNNAVALSFSTPFFSGAEIMTYNPGLSSLNSGVAVWTGQTAFAGGPVVYTRFILTVANQVGGVPLVLTNATAVGLPANVGAVLRVASSTLAFTANMQMLASFSPTSGFTPALALFDAYHPTYGGTAYSSFSAGFYYDTPPHLSINAPLSVNRSQTNTITSGLLLTTDTESSAANLIYTISVLAGNQGGPPHAGSLRLNSTTLSAGSTFTQADVNNGLVTYVQGGDCSTSDSFTFNVNDSDDGRAADGAFTDFTFNINISQPNQPPVANNQSINVGLGASILRTLNGSDPDCVLQPLTYRVVTAPTKGTVVLNNSNLGSFTYTATVGQSGADSFSYQVNDSLTDAVTPGVVSVTIANQAPTALPGNGNITENSVLRGKFSASDPDQPPQTLTYSINVNGSLGTAVITNVSTGGFTYTPNPGAFGSDTVTFNVSDGSLSSTTPGTFSINIQPTPDTGHLIVVDSNLRAVVEIGFNYGGSSPLYSMISIGGLLQNPQAVAVESTGNILVGDANNGLIRVNHATGAQTILAGATNFTGFLKPSGIAIEPSGSILVTDGNTVIQRFNPVTGAASIVCSNAPGTGNTNLVVPFGIAVGASGNIYVADASAAGGQQGRVVMINPTNGAQTLITPLTVSNTLILPTAIALNSSNKIYVAEATSFFGPSLDKVFTVDATSGAVTQLAAGSILAAPLGLAINTNQDLVVANNNPVTSSLLTMSPTNGFQTGLPFPLPKPYGIAIIRQRPIFNSVIRQPDGTVALNITGEIARFVALQYSDDLITWNALAGVPTPTGSVLYLDTSAIGKPKRFYRAFVY